MAGNHTNSRNVNKQSLIETLNVKQVGSSTIFINNHLFILSPSAQNKDNWFDLRKVNLDKRDPKKINLLIVRWKNDFVFCDLNQLINELIINNSYTVTEKSGVNWKFFIEGTKPNDVIIRNMFTKKILKVDYFTDINHLKIHIVQSAVKI